MKYPDDFIGKVINGDCLEIMKQIPDKSIDLVLTDPPYGVNYEYRSYNDTYDNTKLLIKDAMTEILRISKRAAITCGTTIIMDYPKPKWILAWVYGTTNAMNCWGFTSWQPILVYGNDPYLENRMGSRMDIIKDSHAPSKNIEHPCPKPIEFIQKLLERCSVKKTDIVLDPFMGSGTTGLACEMSGRRWIGIEMDAEYCKYANDRILREKNQLKMF